MKRIHYLFWSALLVVSGAYAAADAVSKPAAAPLSVRTVHKTHLLGYAAKPAPGPSERLKMRTEDANASLAPKIVRVPQQEVSDEK